MLDDTDLRYQYLNYNSDIEMKAVIYTSLNEKNRVVLKVLSFKTIHD